MITGQIEDELVKHAKRNQKSPSNNPGSDHPKKEARTVVVYDRNKEVIAEVLLRANGVCEACGSSSGFNRTNGEPYLQVHHIETLADGGPDRTWNAVGICPNCHARCHHGEDAEVYNESLYSKVATLRKSGD